jgi:hypothetical protein
LAVNPGVVVVAGVRLVEISSPDDTAAVTLVGVVVVMGVRLVKMSSPDDTVTEGVVVVMGVRLVKMSSPDDTVTEALVVVKTSWLFLDGVNDVRVVVVWVWL